MRTLEEAVSEVSREIQVRKRCYTRWVQDGKLDQVDATDRLDRMESALEYLNRYKASEDKLTGLRSAAATFPKPIDSAEER